MEFFRQVINSNLLADKLNLPADLKNKTVEITILPIDFPEKKVNSLKLKDIVGIANKDGKIKYNPDKIKKEKEAWAKAAVEKYEQYNN